MLFWLIGVGRHDILGGSRPTVPLPIYDAYRASARMLSTAAWTTTRSEQRKVL
jgi:hypothetical protein